MVSHVRERMQLCIWRVLCQHLCAHQRIMDIACSVKQRHRGYDVLDVKAAELFVLSVFLDHTVKAVGRAFRYHRRGPRPDP